MASQQHTSDNHTESRHVELKEGITVIIIGQILSNTNVSKISLKEGCPDAARTALSISPHFESDHPHIVYETLDANGKVTNQVTSKSPLIIGQLFTIKILVTAHAFKISADDEDLLDYKHQISFTQVNTILVQGMKLDLIDLVHQMPPLKREVINGLKPGKVIEIYGIAYSDCKRIEINLRHRFGIAFHNLFNFVEDAVVRNTWQGNNWGAEERSSGIPFKKGGSFKIEIICSAEQYNVSVNNQQTYTYKHRFTKLEDIDVFEVYGDIKLFLGKVKD